MRAEILATVLVALFAAASSPHSAFAQDPALDPPQSIQVHGHWVIEVSEGDRLVERREFDNALADGGGLLLAELLTGQDTAYDAGVVLVFTEPLEPDNISELPVAAFDGSTTDITTPSSGEDAGKILYTGSYTAPAQHTIDMVAYVVANGAVLPAPGSGGVSYTRLTLKDLPNDVTVQANQHVTVEVTIAFSSG